MTSANVKAIDALGELQQALLRFKSDTLSALDAMQGEIQRTLAWLQERLQYWQRELQLRREALQRAERALAACRAQASRSNSSGADCREFEAAVYACRRLVQEAEQELRMVQSYLKHFTEQNELYQRERHRLSTVLNADLLKGSELLARSKSILSSYVSAGSGGMGSVGAALIGGLAGGIGSAIGLTAVDPGSTGAFSISNWAGYPSSLPRPQGAFKLLSQDEYAVARAQGNAGIRAYKRAHPQEAAGKDIHHIQPIKFGGHPSDESNLVPLTEDEHMLYTRWWRRVQSELESSGGIV